MIREISEVTFKVNHKNIEEIVVQKEDVEMKIVEEKIKENEVEVLQIHEDEIPFRDNVAQVEEVTEGTVEGLKISAFAALVGIHRNIVDNWFKFYEEKGVHYVNRNEKGQKIYFDQDLEILQYIISKRNDKVSHEEIAKELQKMINLRKLQKEVA